MKPSILCRIRGRIALLAMAALAAAIVVGCGGDQIARTGGGGTGIASAIGTVTGFGSTIVDGEAWDDRNARVEVEISPLAGTVAAEARLGQRVEVDYEVRGTADRLMITAEVAGRVSEVAAGASPPRFKVAGQTVRINADPKLGPVTVYFGIEGLATLNVDDLVEVHGSSQFDAQLGRYVVIATRVERLASLPANLVRVSGVVEGLNPADFSFRVGELNVSVPGSAFVVPPKQMLADGQRVIVWSDDPIDAGAAGPTLVADFIRIVERGHADYLVAVDISGSIGRYDPAAMTFEIEGAAVDARSATIAPAGQTLSDGLYVIASGMFNRDGVLQATKVTARTRSSRGAEVELKGTITDFVSQANFQVRGVAVNGTGALLSSECPPTGLANGVYVAIEGRVSAVDGRVDARKIACEDSPSGGVITFEGVASAVDINARTFTLSASGKPARNVAWTDTTYFGSLTPATLAGREVKVDGYFEGTTLIATKIRRDD